MTVTLKFCSGLQGVAACCRVLQCVKVCDINDYGADTLQCVAV